MTLPPAYYLNSRTDAERRHEFEWRLAQAGVKARRFPAPAAADIERTLARRARNGRWTAAWLGGGADGRMVRRPGAVGPQEEPPQDAAGGTRDACAPRSEAIAAYARALGWWLLLRRIRRERLATALVLDDEAAFHPNFARLAEVIEPPDGWDILHLGHTFLDDEPEPAAPGVVRVRRGTGFHAFMVRATAIPALCRALRRWLRQAAAGGTPAPGVSGTADAALAAAQESLRAYGCFPCLGWRDPHAHLPDQAGQAGYGPGGTQTEAPETVERLFHAMFASGRAAEIPQPAAGRTRLALLFLTKGDTHHPDIWREYVSQAPDRVKVFCHPKDPQLLTGGFLASAAIRERQRTAWGDISLVRATLALMRAALADPEVTHLALLSESCVPVRPLTATLKLLDWNPRSRFDWRELAKASPTEKRRALDLPQVPAACWRFQSQWWLLERTAAEWVARADHTGIFATMEIPDEGYFSTVLCLSGFPLADWVERTPSTWTRWERGPHPLSHKRLVPADLRAIMESGALFARKFPQGADIARFGLHRSG